MSEPPPSGRPIAHFSRAAAHDLRGRLNALGLIAGLLDDHADPLVRKAIERLRAVTSDLTEATHTIESIGELYVPALAAPSVSVSTLQTIVARRGGDDVELRLDPADASLAIDVRVAVDPAILTDALVAAAHRSGARLCGRVRFTPAALELRFAEATPRLGDTPSLVGLFVALAAEHGGGEAVLENRALVVRLRIVGAVGTPTPE